MQQQSDDRNNNKKVSSVDSSSRRRRTIITTVVSSGLLLIILFGILYIGYLTVVRGYYYINDQSRISPHCYGLYNHQKQQTTLCHIRKDLPINNAKLIRDGRPTPSKICRPNYYIIGTPKGGTTSLHTYRTKPNIHQYIPSKYQDRHVMVNHLLNYINMDIQWPLLMVPIVRAKRGLL